MMMIMMIERRERKCYLVSINCCLLVEFTSTNTRNWYLTMIYRWRKTGGRERARENEKEKEKKEIRWFFGIFLSYFHFSQFNDVEVTDTWNLLSIDLCWNYASIKHEYFRSLSLSFVCINYTISSNSFTSRSLENAFGNILINLMFI